MNYLFPIKKERDIIPVSRSDFFFYLIINNYLQFHGQLSIQIKSGKEGIIKKEKDELN